MVIPCYNEPNLLTALLALWACARPACAVEVILVVNSAQGSAPDILEANRRTIDQAEAWIGQHSDARLTFHLLHFPDLPAKKSGVGLARKIGMDEALRRFYDAGNPRGVIVCFDADCECDSNYLLQIESYFLAHPGSSGASIYFEHPLAGVEEPRIYEAIILYELHLRYYVEGLREAGFPHAFHTVGSSMAVRAEAYLKEGGMNKRQAGEDFYFLHKIIPLGRFGEINSTRVIASPRPSDRVPFGTGRSVREFLETGRFSSYPTEAFDDLKALFAAVKSLYSADDMLDSLSKTLAAFLQLNNASRQLQMIRDHTSSVASFEKRFFRWFDGFLAMKYIHFARDQAYDAGDVVTVARTIYRRRSGVGVESIDARDLLLAYRNWQRQVTWVPAGA